MDGWAAKQRVDEINRIEVATEQIRARLASIQHGRPRIDYPMDPGEHIFHR